MPLHQLIGDDQIDHRIAEELQPFVVADARLIGFIDEGAVGERLDEQHAIGEAVPEALLEAFVESARIGMRAHRIRSTAASIHAPPTTSSPRYKTTACPGA